MSSLRVEIINLQRKIAVDIGPLRAFASAAMENVTTGNSTATIAFISDRRMKQLNELFRGNSATTDVLSFPHEPSDFEPDKDNLGDIVIAVEQAQRQAAENQLTLEGEIKQLILHGLLHLCGYDHETDNGEMNVRELELRDKLAI